MLVWFLSSVYCSGLACDFVAIRVSASIMAMYLSIDCLQLLFNVDGIIFICNLSFDQDESLHLWCIGSIYPLHMVCFRKFLV